MGKKEFKKALLTTLNAKYIIAFIIILAIEVVIALYINDKIVRPYIGDILVIFLLYALVRAVIKKSIKLLPVYIFAFALIIEIAQYYHIVDVLQLNDKKILSIIIGTSFDIKDILCYLFATGVLVAWETRESKYVKIN